MDAGGGGGLARRRESRDRGSSAGRSGEDASRRHHQLLPPKAAQTAQRLRRAKTMMGRSPRGDRETGRAGTSFEEAASGYQSGDEGLRSPLLPPRHQRPARHPAAPPPPPSTKSVRERIYKAMNGRSTSTEATVFKTFLSFIIAFNVIVFMLSTMPRLRNRYGHFFDMEEAVCSCFFLVEYAIRLWACVESHKYSGWAGRIKYVLKYSSICDALATFPFFIEAVVSVVIPKAHLPNTTFIRMFSIFRVLKTERYLNSFESVGRVLYFNREILATSMVFSLLLVIMTATALFYADPEQFPSIPATLYVSVGMLTGSGSPEDIDSVALRVISGISSVFSVAVCAIPAAMLAWGFEAEAEKRIEARREVLKAKAEAERLGIAYDYHSSTSESSDSSWEEYDSDLDELGEMETIKEEINELKAAVSDVAAGMKTLISDVKALKQHAGIASAPQ